MTTLLVTVFQLEAIRHSVDKALPVLRALPVLSDHQFLWLSQFFQLFQVSQISHSSEALGSMRSSNSIIKELEELRDPKSSKEWEIQESWKS